MNSPIGPNEIRVVIRPVEARDYDLGPIPAELFKKTFDAFLTALQVTDRELQPKARSSEFLVSQLALNPYEFGILEKRKALSQTGPSAIEFFRRCAEGIYRSDYQAVVRHPRVTRAFIRIVKALNPSFHVLAQFKDTELPIDDFFAGRSIGSGQRTMQCGQTTGSWAARSCRSRVGSTRSTIAAQYGQATSCFRQEQPTSSAFLTSHKAKIALNPFGNKNVCVTGRAIYTGDSQLPERIEVLAIEERAHVNAAIDIRGSLRMTTSLDEDNDLDCVE